MCRMIYRRPQWRSSRKRINSGTVRKKPEKRVGRDSNIVKAGSGRRKETKPFNFMGLPQELKDEIYSYIVGAKADFSTTIYHSETTQFQYRWFNLPESKQAGHVPSSPGLLRASRDMFDGALATLYRENSFTVVMDPSFPFFGEREFRLRNSRNAVPYGWDLARVQHLQLCIDMAAENDIERTRFDFDFRGLREMTDLKSLRLVVTIWRWGAMRGGGWSPQQSTGGEEVATEFKGYDEVRETLRRVGEKLPDGFGNIKFGMERPGEKAIEGAKHAFALSSEVTEKIFVEAKTAQLERGENC